MSILPQIHLAHLGCTTIDTWWKCHFTDAFWRLYCNADDGAVLFFDGRKPWSMPANELIMLPPRPGWRSDSPRPVRHAHFSFYLLGVASDWARQAFSRPVSLGRIDDWQKTFGNIGKPGSYQVEEVYRYQALLARCVADAFARLPAEQLATAKTLGVTAKVVEPALHAIHNEYGRPWSVAGLAKICHITPDHLTRIFRGSLGQTPQRYLRERRIMAAAQLLLEQDWPIERIAEETGFANRYHFTRAFSQIMNVAPAAYRRANGR
jgi:AraC-like DNA-binding protein